MAFVLENPLGWVHFRLRGGTKMLLTWGLTYGVVIAGLIMLSIRIEPARMSATLGVWTQVLMMLQGAILVFFAGGAIRKSVRQDFTTRMIESHRLMPVSGMRAVAGYLSGPATLFVGLSVQNVLIGSITSAASGQSVTGWLLANANLGIMAVATWCAMLLAAMVSPAPIGLLICLVLVTTNRVVAIAVPAVGVLVGPLLSGGTLGINVIGSWNWAHQVSALAQLVFAGICLAGAIRKYRREDVLAFPPRMALLILAGWLLISGVGIRHAKEFIPFGAPSGNDEAVPVVGSILGGLLVGILPVTSAVWQRRQWLARRNLQDMQPGAAPMPPEMIALSAAAFVGLFGLFIREERWPFLALTTAGVSLSFLLSIVYLHAILYRGGGQRGGLVLGLFIALTWGLPFGFDAAGWAMQDDLLRDGFTWISTCSPVGAIAAATMVRAPSPAVGVIVQFLPALLLGWLYYRPHWRRAA